MSLAGMLEQLYTRRRFGIRPGIDRVQQLLKRLGHPETAFRTIHVVGTNGKGSTSAFLASILASAHIRTALFTSPHLISFTERFRINGNEIPLERLEPLIGSVLEKASSEATFFEIVTALAVLYFAEEGVEVAVVEAGMGGGSDATAALPGIMTLMTPVSMDHSSYLGATPEAIAVEKTAIAKSGTPLISAIQTHGVMNAIQRHTMINNNRLVTMGHDFSATWSDPGKLTYTGIHTSMTDIRPGIPGRYQAENAALALAGAEILTEMGVPVSREAMHDGIAQARWPGRMEQVPGRPALILDGAHNAAGARVLAESLADYSFERLFLVAGMMEDKDVDAILAPLVKLAFRAFAVSPSIERALPAKVLADILRGYGLETMCCRSVGNGIEQARSMAQPGDLVLVCGSLFTVGEAKAWLEGRPFEGIRG